MFEDLQSDVAEIVHFGDPSYMVECMLCPAARIFSHEDAEPVGMWDTCCGEAFVHYNRIPIHKVKTHFTMRYYFYCPKHREDKPDICLVHSQTQ